MHYAYTAPCQVLHTDSPKLQNEQATAFYHEERPGDRGDSTCPKKSDSLAQGRKFYLHTFFYGYSISSKGEHTADHKTLLRDGTCLESKTLTHYKLP